jgi:alkylmercury lyase
MSDQTCDCCGEMTVGQSTEPAPSSDRWLDERPVTDAPLPSDVANTMSQFLGESVETLDDFVTAARDATGGGALAVDDLCHTEDETPHRAIAEDETYHFECFYDGVALAHLVNESVEIRTESPAHERIETRASPEGDIDVTPSDAVMSFGIAVGVEPPAADGRPVDEAAVAAMCPYVKAFPTRESYERWAETVDAATVGMPLTAGVPVAAALIE